MNIFLATNRELCNLTSRVSNPKASEPNIERLTSGCECLNKIYLGWPIDDLAYGGFPWWWWWSNVAWPRCLMYGRERQYIGCITFEGFSRPHKIAFSLSSFDFEKTKIRIEAKRLGITLEKNSRKHQVWRNSLNLLQILQFSQFFNDFRWKVLTHVA